MQMGSLIRAVPRLAYVAIGMFAVVLLCWLAAAGDGLMRRPTVDDLIRAIELGDADRARELIRLGLGNEMYRPPHSTERWCRPIHVAAAMGNYRMLELLLDQQELVANARDFEGRTPLMYLCNQCEMQRSVDYLKCLEALQRARCEMNAASDSGETALHIATHPVFVTEFLLRAGSDPNRMDRKGNTPLHSACLREKERLGPNGSSADAVPSLLLAGADPTIVNQDGQTPLQLAIENGRDDIVAILERYSQFLKEKRRKR